MEILKKTLTFLFIATFTLTTFAQDEAEALDILKKTRNKVETKKIVEISFSYVISYAETEKPEKYEGTFLAKGKKFKLEIDNTITYCNGKTRWVYLPESNEVNISNVEASEEMELEEQFMNDPLSIFRLYEMDFKYRMTGNVDYEGKNVWQIDFMPNDKNKPYFKVRSWIKDDYELMGIRYFQKDATIITMNILDNKADSKHKESEFEFNVADYPDIEIIDLR